MRHKHRVRQTIINYFLSLVLIISLMVVVIMSVGKFSFASERALEHAGNKTHYYYNLKNSIEEKSINYAIPFGIDKECIVGVFQENEVKDDVLKVTSERVEGQKEMVDFGIIEKRIRTNVEKKFGKLSATQKKSLNIYINKVKKMYYSKIHLPTESFMANVINKSTKIAWIAIPLSAIIAIFCMFYLIVSRHYAYHGIRYVVYGILGAGTFVTVGFAALISNEAIYNVNVSDPFLKEFYVYWIGHPILMLVFFGIGMLVAGLIGIFIAYRDKYAVRG